MGNVIELRPRTRTGPAGGAPAAARRCAAARADFHFDLHSAFSYLAAERVEGLLSDLRWVPSLAGPGPVSLTPEAAERRAAELGLPLIWPTRGSGDPLVAMRVAAFAVESGRGAAFALAAARLAFCGGFDLEEPASLAEAATAAGLDAASALRAAGDRDRDWQLLAAGRRCGPSGPPAVRVGGHLYPGEAALTAAALAADGRSVWYSGPSLDRSRGRLERRVRIERRVRPERPERHVDVNGAGR